ncbi:MAG: hypothetical protein Q8M92_10660 [Candidatus Subteraquimicrobiales bacterium]|nr:hypothetical protein [Candidatus Subteraquimicrobiales bacterium]
MAYADTTRLSVLLKEYNYADDQALITEGCTQGDNRVDRFINNNLSNYNTPQPVPQEFVDAGTLFSAAAILNILLSNQDKLSPTAVKWEEEALEILQGYVDGESSDTGNRGSPVRFLTVTKPETE